MSHSWASLLVLYRLLNFRFSADRPDCEYTILPLMTTTNSLSLDMGGFRCVSLGSRYPGMYEAGQIG